MPDTPSHSTLEAVSAARWRIAISLTAAMMAAYFGFILLVAFNKPLLGTRIAPGLSLGILLGALVILVAWVLTWAYIHWANAHYDASIQGLRPPPPAHGLGTVREESASSRPGARNAGNLEGRR
jgi:uncharacterized membrane protein (DUF485 family)